MLETPFEDEVFCVSETSIWSPGTAKYFSFPDTRPLQRRHTCSLHDNTFHLLLLDYSEKGYLSVVDKYPIVHSFYLWMHRNGKREIALIRKNTQYFPMTCLGDVAMEALPNLCLENMNL